MSNQNLGNSNNINLQANNASGNNVVKETEKTLDTLFRKTNTLPNIYYLPLSEEEVK